MTLSEPNPITAELLDAYRTTDYRVYTDPLLTLRVGQHDQQLQTWMAEQHVHNAAFLTAFNPFSMALAQAENTTRQLGLQTQLDELGLSWVAGVGEHPSGQWAGEVSCLVVNLSLEQAETLARDWRQNAFIWVDGSATPTLKLLR